MKETRFSHIFINDHMIRKWPYMWFMKIHGHEMQQSSIPDYLFCINGSFVAIEFKIQRDGKISTTPLQMREVTKIINAKGIGLVVAFDENHKKILVRNTRIDWRTIKSKYIKLDWDYEFNNYENSIHLIDIMVEENKWIKNESDISLTS